MRKPELRGLKAAAALFLKTKQTKAHQRNSVTPGDFETVKNRGERLLDRAFQVAGSSFLIWGQVCALWRSVFLPSRPGSGCSAHI